MTRSRSMVALVMLTFFVISLLSNILGPIIPDVIRDFHVSLSSAGFLVFSFFIAYGVMSIPAGLLVESLHERTAMLLSFVAAAAGALCFAAFPRYPVAVVSLFLIGAGMATLQVAINPLLRTAGGEEHFAFNEVLAQLLFGLASFVSPRIYSWLVLNMGRPTANRDGGLLGLLGRITPASLPWVAVYWVFAAVAVSMLVPLSLMKFPAVPHREEERPGNWEVYRQLLRRPLVWLYFVAIFAYVGCEQGISNWLSQFLSQYHGFNPHTTGARAVSWFWGLMTLGCLAGVLLLKLFDSRRILVIAASGALLTLSLALFGSAAISLVAFPATGLFCSVMWPILISLGLNSIPEHHGSFTGILATGIMGGAVLPIAIGHIGDLFGLRSGLTLLYLNLGFIFSVGIWARPLINNVTPWATSAAPSTAKGAC